MKTLLQSIVITSIAFYITVLIAPGLVISGNYVNFLLAAATFVIATAVLRPLLSIVAFPFAYLSGIVVLILSNAIALYIVALLYKTVKITSFTFSTAGITNQNYQVGNLLSYIVLSVIIALIIKVLEWVFDRN